MWVKWCVLLHFRPKERRNPWDPRDAQARNTEGAARPSPHGRRSSRARKARGVAKPFNGVEVLWTLLLRKVVFSRLLGFGFPCPSFLVVALAPSPPLLLSPPPATPHFGKWCSLPPLSGGLSSFGLVVLSPFLFEVMVVSFSSFGWWCFSLSPTFSHSFGWCWFPEKTAPAQRTQGAKHHGPKERGRQHHPTEEKGKTAPPKRRRRNTQPNHPNTPPNTQPTLSFFLFCKFFALVVSQNNTRYKQKNSKVRKLNNRNQIQKRKNQTRKTSKLKQSRKISQHDTRHPTTQHPNTEPITRPNHPTLFLSFQLFSKVVEFLFSFSWIFVFTFFFRF